MAVWRREQIEGGLAQNLKTRPPAGIRGVQHRWNVNADEHQAGVDAALGHRSHLDGGPARLADDLGRVREHCDGRG